MGCPALPGLGQTGQSRRVAAETRKGTISLGMEEKGEVTRLLSEMRSGDQAAARLLPIVYQELRRLAAGVMKRERPGHTLQPTAVVHEAYVRLITSDYDKAALMFAPQKKGNVTWTLQGYYHVPFSFAIQKK